LAKGKAFLEKQRKVKGAGAAQKGSKQKKKKEKNSTQH